MRKLNLCLHAGSRSVARDQVLAVATPPRTPTWVPIPHHRLLAGVQSAIGSILRLRLPKQARRRSHYRQGMDGAGL